MITYTFLKQDNSKVDVKASSPEAAINKLFSMPQHSNLITRSYSYYSNSGVLVHGFVEKLDIPIDNTEPFPSSESW